jgi:hypothetical protein
VFVAQPLSPQAAVDEQSDDGVLSRQLVEDYFELLRVRLRQRTPDERFRESY